MKQNGQSRKSGFSLAAQYLAVLIMCLIILLPIFILLIASFKTSTEFAKTPLFQLPKEWTLDNYRQVLERGNFVVGFINTFVIILASTVINVLLGSALGYALGRFQFRGRKLILALIMGARVIPTITTQVATFTIIRSLHLYNTIGAPIILYAGSDVVQTILFMQHVANIPESLDETALIDGASYFRIYWSIILPLLRPATVTVIILKVVMIYNDMYIPFLYMPSKKLQVVSTAVMKFCSSNYGAVYPVLAAVFMIVMLPVFLMYIFVQRQLFSGITAGAVKE